MIEIVEDYMMIVLLFILYVSISATGLTLIKMGTMRYSTLLINSSGFELKINWILALGLCIYVLSFILSIIVMKNMNLSFFYPISAGLVYILVSVLGFFVLHESISKFQLVGMGIVLAGIVIMNIGRIK